MKEKYNIFDYAHWGMYRGNFDFSSLKKMDWLGETPAHEIMVSNIKKIVSIEITLYDAGFESKNTKRKDVQDKILDLFEKFNTENRQKCDPTLVWMLTDGCQLDENKALHEEAENEILSLDLSYEDYKQQEKTLTRLSQAFRKWLSESENRNWAIRKMSYPSWDPNRNLKSSNSISDEQLKKRLEYITERSMPECSHNCLSDVKNTFSSPIEAIIAELLYDPKHASRAFADFAPEYLECAKTKGERDVLIDHLIAKLEKYRDKYASEFSEDGVRFVNEAMIGILEEIREEEIEEWENVAIIEDLLHVEPKGEKKEQKNNPINKKGGRQKISIEREIEKHIENKNIKVKVPELIKECRTILEETEEKKRINTSRDIIVSLQDLGLYPSGSVYTAFTATFGDLVVLNQSSGDSFAMNKHREKINKEKQLCEIINTYKRRLMKHVKA